MPSFLGGKSRGAFGQPTFFLAGITRPPSLLKKRFFKSLVCSAKRFSSTEVKFRTWENGKKKFKRILSCLFDERRKVQVTLNLPSWIIFLVGSAANSDGTTLEFAAFGGGPDAKPSRAGAFWIPLSITMVFGAVRTLFHRKNTRVYCISTTCVTSNRVEVVRIA